MIQDSVQFKVSRILYSTHPPLDNMATILQTMTSNAFSWMKSFVLQLEFYCFKGSN